MRENMARIVPLVVQLNPFGYQKETLKVISTMWVKVRILSNQFNNIKHIKTSFLGDKSFKAKN